MAKKNSYSDSHAQLALFAKALSHPARVYILEVLSNKKCCFSGDMAEEVPIARSTLSQHLKELKYSGLIQGNIEPPKIRYCIKPENWKKAKKLFNGFFTEIKIPKC